MLPSLRDWRKTTTSTTNTVITPHQPMHHEAVTVQPTSWLQTTTVIANEAEINVISFEHDGSEISVMVEDGLSNTSTLVTVMKESDVAREFN